MFQKYNLLPTLTAEENIEIARDIAGNKAKIDPQFVEIVRMLGIEERLHHKPRAFPAASSSASPSPAPS